MSPHTGAEPPLLLRVTIDGDGTRFRAVIEVSGRKQGIRELDAAGPTCDELADALLVSLMLLLDEDPSRRVPEPSSAAPLARRAAEPAPATPRAQRAAEPAPVASVWIATSGAVTHGLPEGVSGALAADVWLRWSAWQAGAGVIWAPERKVPFAPGSVDVHAIGGRVHACFAPLSTHELRISGCAVGAILSLSGSGEGYVDSSSVRRPWFLAGAGPELDWFAGSRIVLGLSGFVLVTLHDESFSVEGLKDKAWETDRLVAGLGAHIALQIW